MKRTRYLIIAAITLSLSAGIYAGEINNRGVTKKTAGNYTLVWQDNFDGNVLNEETNWNIETDGEGNGNRELQYYKRENLSIGKEPVSGENCLIITAKKEKYSGKECTSGRITTQNKMTFTFGKIEARIKLPKTANGLWPAFWLLGADFPAVGWPRSGEIDILEMGHTDGIRDNTQDRLFNGACHWGYYQPEGWFPSHAQHKINPYTLQDDDFHLYTLIWDNESIRMYLDMDKYPDASPYYELGLTSRDSDISPYYYFNKPFFVILNLAIGGNFTQIWDINKITALNAGDAYMYVDYVRVYQKGDEGEEYNGPKLEAGIKPEYSSGSSLIYPNPATDYICIKSEDKARKVYITSLYGQKVMSLSDPDCIDISPLSSGHYIVKILEGNGQQTVSQLIKR